MGNDCIAEACCIAPVFPRGDKPADNLEHNFDQVFHFLFPFFSFSILFSNLFSKINLIDYSIVPFEKNCRKNSVWNFSNCENVHFFSVKVRIILIVFFFLKIVKIEIFEILIQMFFPLLLKIRDSFACKIFKPKQ